MDTSLWKLLWKRIRPAILLATVVTETVGGVFGVANLTFTGYFWWAVALLFFVTLTGYLLICEFDEEWN